MYVLIRLPDRPLREGLVSYFNTHKKDLKRLNGKQRVVVPKSVFSEIRKHVIADLLGNAPAPVSIKKELPLAVEKLDYKEDSGAVPSEELIEKIDTLYDEIYAIKGIGAKTAMDIVEQCSDDREILKMKLKNDDIDIRDDYLKLLHKKIIWDVS